MSTDLKELARVLNNYGDHCHGSVTRDGEQDACGKPAVAIDHDDFGYWPACAWHVNRYGPGVPLTEIVAALRQADREAEA